LIQNLEIDTVLLAVWARLKLEGVAQFSLSPGKAPAIAVFIPEKNVSIQFGIRLYGKENFG
jgi:translation initiation factor 2A